MTKGETKANTIKRTGDYIEARLSGSNKQDSAIQAGYQESTARNPSIIERSTTYQIIVEKILVENASTMHILATLLNQSAQKGDFDELKPIEQAQLYKIITDTNDKLTPKVTVKRSTDAKGNQTTTAWGSNAAALHEALG